ncbi:hypothetical protein LCGC14_2510290 [marine sediment metagenome]|uniref:Uncharacterized protein n=1 Tax=marine sediment metagenome TaxID=412755 RepID=A0A0F9DB37_9ZZZZ
MKWEEVVVVFLLLVLANSLVNISEDALYKSKYGYLEEYNKCWDDWDEYAGEFISKIQQAYPNITLPEQRGMMSMLRDEGIIEPFNCSLKDFKERWVSK